MPRHPGTTWKVRKARFARVMAYSCIGAARPARMSASGGAWAVYLGYAAKIRMLKIKFS